MPPSAEQQIKGAKADCYYGATGTGKTGNVGQMALWVWEKYHKPTRLVSADGGGWETIQPLVDSGIVVPWMVRDRKNQIEGLDQACQGYWPVNPEDPASPLLPPFSLTWTVNCPTCGYSGVTTDPKKLQGQKYVPCPKCSEANKGKAGYKPPMLPVITKWAPNPDNDVTKFAGYAFEGLTSFGDLILKHLADTGASLSQDPSFRWTDGETTYSGGNQTYYGFTQSRLYDFVMKTNMLPVQKVVWTAMEAKGEDETTKAPIYGPAIAGKKATGKAGGWFGNMLHFDMAETTKAVAASAAGQQTEVTLEYRMYIKPHAEALTRVVYPAKTRCPFAVKAKLPDLWVAPDVHELYNRLDKLQAEARGMFEGPKPEQESVSATG